MLCVGCVERRLGRTLRPDDFIDCQINTDHAAFPKSKRLFERFGEFEPPTLPKAMNVKQED
jgi:hypothetical protein